MTSGVTTNHARAITGSARVAFKSARVVQAIPASPELRNLDILILSFALPHWHEGAIIEMAN